MRSRLLLVPALLAVAAGAATTQTAPPATTPPAEKSIDQLVERLELVRAQRAELERQEHELVNDIRRKVDAQAARLPHLGVGSTVTPPAAVERVAVIDRFEQLGVKLVFPPPDEPRQGSFYVGLFGGN